MSAKSIKKTGKALRRDRNKDYRETKSINDAMFKNVLKSGKGTKRRLTKSNERQLDLMRKSAEKMAASASREVRRQTRRHDRLGNAGGMLSELYSRSNKTLSTTASVAKQQSKADVKYGKSISTAGDYLLKLGQQGVREAQAGADYLAAKALQQRATQDTALIAEMRHDEEMLRLQAEIAAQAAKAEFERQVKLLELSDQLEDENAKKKNKTGTWMAMKNILQAATAAGAQARLLLTTDERFTTLKDYDPNDEADATALADFVSEIAGTLPTYIENPAAFINPIVNSVLAGGHPTRDTIKEVVYGMDPTGAYRRYGDKRDANIDKLIGGWYKTALGPAPPSPPPADEDEGGGLLPGVGKVLNKVDDAIGAVPSALIELVTGNDSAEQGRVVEDLGTGVDALATVAAGAGLGKLAGKGLSAAGQAIAKTFKLNVDDVLPNADDIAKQFVGSADELASAPAVIERAAQFARPEVAQQVLRAVSEGLVTEAEALQLLRAAQNTASLWKVITGNLSPLG